MRRLTLLALLFMTSLDASGDCDVSRREQWLAVLRSSTPEQALAVPADDDPVTDACELPMLIAAMTDPVPHVRAHAARLLGDSLVTTGDVVPSLARLLRDPDAAVRSEAVLALIKRGGESATVLAAVARHAPTEDDFGPHPADYAILALGEIGAPAVPAVAAAVRRHELLVSDAREIFGSMDESARAALDAAAKDPTVRPAVPVAIDPKHPQCDWLELEQFAGRIVDVAHMLEVCARRSPQDVARVSPWVLSWIAGDASRDERAKAASRLLPLIHELLAARSDDSRRTAARLVVLAGDAASAETAGLVTMLGSRESNVRAAALYALAAIGPAARGAVGPLRELLLRKDADHEHVARVLLAIDGSEEVVRWIESIAERSDEYTALTLAMNLARNGASSELRRLARAAEDHGIRSQAIGALLDADPTDEEARALRMDAVRSGIDAESLVKAFRGPVSDAEAALLGEIVMSPLTKAALRTAALEALRAAGASGAKASRYLRAYAEHAGDGDGFIAVTLFAIDPSPDTATSVLKMLDTDDLPTLVWHQRAGQALGTIPDLRYDYLLPSLAARRTFARRSVMDAVARQRAVRDDMVPYILNAAGDADEDVRVLAAQILSRITTHPGAAEFLTCLLRDPEVEVREVVADALDDASTLPSIAEIMAQRFAREHVENSVRWSSFSRHRLHEATAAAAQTAPAFDIAKRPPLPSFPLPPPGYSDYDPIDRDLVGRDSESLATVHDRLAKVLRELGYDTQSLFAVPGGFALMTLIERIDDAGRPFTPPARWTRVRRPPHSIREYLQMLFAEKPGHFRLFVFIITPQDYLGVPTARLAEDQADALFERGGRILPASIGGQRFAGHFCHALVYAFDKRAGQRAILLTEQQDALHLIGHLRGAGILSLLTPLR